MSHCHGDPFLIARYLEQERHVDGWTSDGMLSFSVPAELQRTFRGVVKRLTRNAFTAVRKQKGKGHYQVSY